MAIPWAEIKERDRRKRIENTINLIPLSKWRKLYVSGFRGNRIPPDVPYISDGRIMVSEAAVIPKRKKHFERLRNKRWPYGKTGADAWNYSGIVNDAIYCPDNQVPVYGTGVLPPENLKDDPLWGEPPVYWIYADGGDRAAVNADLMQLLTTLTEFDTLTGQYNSRGKIDKVIAWKDREFAGIIAAFNKSELSGKHIDLRLFTLGHE